MKYPTCFIIALLWLVIAELKLSNQIECPYLHWNEAYTSGAEALTAIKDENVLKELGVVEHMPQKIKHWNIVKPIEEAALPAIPINTLLKKSPRSNNIKKVAFGGAFEDKYDDLKCSVPPVSCLNSSSNFYIRTYDGSCNNLENPGHGMAKSRYSRILKPKYGDGFYTPSKSSTGHALPNPRILSLSLYGEETLPDSKHTLMAMQFAQFIAHDISRFYQQGAPSDCCAKSRIKMCYPIPLQPFDPITMTTGKTCMNFARSLSDKDISCPPSGLPYAEKITTTTAFLDLSSIYGNTQKENTKIRHYKGGLLKTSWFNKKPFLPIQTGECPANNEQCYSIPDNRNQFTPTVTVVHTIFVREHNRLANILARINPQYTDEQIFQVARKINIAQFQKITYYDWLPIVMSPMYSIANRLNFKVSSYDYVNDYEQNLNPAPYAEYAAAAFRYLHHSIPGWFSLVSSGRNSNQTLRYSDFFDRQDSMQLLMDGNNFESLIRGLVTQLQKRVDNNIDREIKHHFDRKSIEEFGTDLKSIDIQRGRDFGLPSYNDYRSYCGLKRAHQWPDFLSEISTEKIEVLKKFYVSPNEVELSIGGSLEKHAPDSMLGPTFQCIIGKQFLKTRAADRFFYENGHSGFTRDQLAEIRKISLASILCANGNNLDCIQSNVFVFPNHQNHLIKCKTLPQLDLRFWKDYAIY